MEFGVLGPVEVGGDAGPLRLSGAKQRSLLAIFLSRPGQVISTDRLIDDLWDGNPPDSAPTALRVHMTNLRGVLEPERSRSSPSVRLPATPPGYRLMLEPDELDAQRFERILVKARDEASRASPSATVASLERALGLWRGPPFADVRDLSCLQGEVARLEELRVSAFEELVEAGLADGQHAALVGRLETAVADHPLRERLTGQLMLALYRGGRQADALRTYSRLRVRLGEDLGIDPSPGLQALEEAILLQRSELVWQPSQVGPSVVSRREREGHKGRAGELERLRASLAAVVAGGQTSVFLSGPAGIGKTWLATALGDAAREAGAHVLHGRCDPAPVAPYQPIVEAIRSGLRERSREGAGDWNDPLAVELTRLVPELGPRAQSESLPHGTEPDSDRYRLFEAVAGFLRHVAPAVIILDDLQWADASTILLVRHLARHTDLDRLMLLGTFRDTDVDPSHPLADALVHLRRDDLIDEIRLAGLSRGDVGQLLEAHAPAALLERLLPFADVVHEITAGNPFFVKEVVRDLSERDVAFEEPNVLRQLAPAGVRDLVGQRVARLSPAATSVIRVAGVIGQTFRLDVLARASGMHEDLVLEPVEEALGARLVEEIPDAIDEFAFSHPLIRNVIYSGLATSRRLRLHRSVGEALENLSDDELQGRLTELARHFVEAAPTSVAQKAAQYSIAAGDSALRIVAYEEAIGHYERALALPGVQLEDTVRGSTLLSLGRALEGAGSRDEARARYLEAADIGRGLENGELLADVAACYAGPWVNVGEANDTLLGLLDDALVRTPSDDVLRRASLLNLKAGALYHARGDDEEGLARAALEMTQHARLAPARLAGLTAWHRFLTHDPGTTEERIRFAREIASIADAELLDDQRLMGRRLLLGDLLEVGAMAEFAEHLDEYASLASDLRRPSHIWWASALAATRASFVGDLDEAQRLAEEARRVGDRLDQSDAIGAYILQSFVVRYQQGRLGEVSSTIETPIEYREAVPSWFALMATFLSETGRHDEARAVIDRLLRRGFETMPRDTFWLASMCLLAGAAAKSGATGAIGALESRLSPYADRFVVFGAGGAVLGVVHHWLGLLAAADGRRRDAEAHLTMAFRASTLAMSEFWAQRAEDLLLGPYGS